MLDQDLVRGTLDVALAGGADFAEVFVEDRRGVSAMLHDGKVEELTSGRDRGAGIRVIAGDKGGRFRPVLARIKNGGDLAKVLSYYCHTLAQMSPCLPAVGQVTCSSLV